MQNIQRRPSCKAISRIYIPKYRKLYLGTTPVGRFAASSGKPCTGIVYSTTSPTQGIGKGSIKIRQQCRVLHACAVRRSPGVLVSSCQPLQLYVNKGHAGISRYYKRKERRKETHRRTHTRRTHDTGENLACSLKSTYM